MTKRVRKVPLLATRCVCPIDYELCKRDKLAGEKASKRKDSFFVIHALCVCLIDYGPCRRDELDSVIKDTGGARGVKQSVLVSASEVMRYDKASERKDSHAPCVPFQLWALLER
ncbi:hypothetical protein ElyMa_001848600 [Elysia marginata]|uniref:BRCT domain-containing protein n=1 Tax=Elysia marginata TaxID=1093978 RepID=A0AAV4EK81_9GAST|nr:hypothetical protein ElyMa_001848600 [Elysia marginata]